MPTQLSLQSLRGVKRPLPTRLASEVCPHVGADQNHRLGDQGWCVRLIRLTVAALTLGLVVGCGPRTSVSDSDDLAGSGRAGGGGAGGGGEIPEGGGPGGGSALPEKAGVIALTPGDAYARFGKRVDLPAGAPVVVGGNGTEPGMNCSTKVEDSCTIALCPIPDEVPRTDVPPTDLAGTITLAGGRLSDPGATLEFKDTQYFRNFSPTGLLTSGDTVSVSASGQTVPAFTNQTVQVPEAMALKTPRRANGETFTVDRSKALTLSWDNRGVGTVDVEFWSTIPGQGRLKAWCRFPVSAGAAEVSPRVLSEFPSNSSGLFFFGASNTSVFRAGDYEVSLTALVGLGADVWSTEFL